MAGERRELDILRQLDAGVDTKTELGLLRELETISPSQQQPQVEAPVGLGSQVVPSELSEQTRQALGGQVGPVFPEDFTQRLVERGKSGQESIEAARRGEIGAFQLPVQVAGQVAGGVLDVLGSAITEPFKAAGTLLPEGVKEGAGEIITEGAKALSKTGGIVAAPFLALTKTPVGEAGVSALQAGTEKWGEFKKENPNAAKTIESAANIGLLVAPAASRTITGKATILERKATVMKRVKHDDFVHDLILPQQTKKVLTEQAGRTTEQGVLRTKKVALSKREKQIFDEVKKIRGISKANDFGRNRNIIGKEVDVLARKLEAEVGKRRIFILRSQVMDDVTKSLDDLVNNNPLVASDVSFSKMAETIKNNAERILKKHPQTPRGVLQARREFDSWARTMRKSTFDDTTTNTFKESIRSVRTSMNNVVDKTVPSAAVKSSLRKQNLLIEALENIDPKAAAEGSNAIVRTFNRLSPIGSVRTKLVQGAGTVTGLGVIGASAFFSKPLAVALGIGAISYGGRKALMSATTKRGVAKLLRMIDKAIPTTKNPSLLREMRADRAVISELLKNSEIKKEEQDGTKVQQ